MNKNAKVVVLRRMEDTVPEFNRYAAQLKARGSVIRCGDCLIVYRVASTVPKGPVMVTESTKFVFAS